MTVLYALYTVLKLLTRRAILQLEQPRQLSDQDAEELARLKTAYETLFKD